MASPSLVRSPALAAGAPIDGDALGAFRDDAGALAVLRRWAVLGRNGRRARNRSKQYRRAGRFDLKSHGHLLLVASQ